MPPKSAPIAKGTTPAGPPSSKGNAVAPRAKVRGKKITKAETAKLLNVSTSMVRVLMRSGELAYEVVDGVNYFDRSVVIALAAKRSANPKYGRRGAGKSSPATSTAGELAAHAFDLLASGVSPVDLVMQMKVTPEWVEDVVAKFNALRSLEVARISASDAKCATCKENVARFCAGCANGVRKAAPPPPAAASSA